MDEETERATGEGDTTPLRSLLPELVANWPIDSPGLNHRRISGTMLHADLTGSSRLSERLQERGREGTEVLTAHINAAFDPIIAAGLDQGGDILKFGGDAVLVLFTGEDHARRGIQAGVQMQLGLTSTPSARSVGLTMTVGVHTGVFDFWMIGDDGPELLVAGPGGTTTVEVEESADPGQVLASVETIEELASPAPMDLERGEPPTRLLYQTAPSRAAATPLPPGSPVEQFVPRPVRKSIGTLARIHGEHRIVTCGFVLCQGIGALLEQTPPDGVARQLDRFIRSVREAEAVYGISFLSSDVAIDGFKITLAAGAPSSTGSDDDAMIRAVRHLVECPVQFEIRGAAHRGRVFAGFVGSDERRTYTLMGDDVNLTAHLLGKAANRDVVATDELLGSLTISPDVRPLEPFTVKGKTTLVHGALVDRTPSDLDSPVGPKPRMEMIGRDTQLRELRQAIRDAEQGRGAVVEVVGDSGAGKTRLLQAMASIETDLVIARRSCDRFRSSDSHGIVRALIRQVIGIPGDAGPADAGRLLTSAIRETSEETQGLAPLVGQVIGADVEPTDVSRAVAPEFFGPMAARAVANLLVDLGRPLLLAVEDTQWIDPASLDLLRSLSVDMATKPWLIILTRPSAGPTFSDEASAAATATIIDVPPLTGDTLERLIVRAAAPRFLPTERLRDIAESSRGNPLFAIQLASSGSAAGNGMPDDIEALITSQFDELPTESQLILRLVSVLGRETDARVAQEFVETELGSHRPVDLMVVGDFLKQEGQTGLSFIGNLYREVAYGGLPFAARRRLHLAAGSLLEARAGAGQPVSPAVLAFHFSLAGDRRRAWRYGVGAGDRATARYANEEASEAYTIALRAALGGRVATLPERHRVAVALGDVLERRGRYADADTAYRSAQRLAGSANARAIARQRRAWIHIRRGDWQSARSLQTRILNTIDAVDGPSRKLRRTVQLDRLGLMTRGGSIEEFERLAAEVIASARRDGDGVDEARACDYRLGHMSDPPRPDQAEQLASTAVHHFEEAGDEAGVASVSNNLGLTRHNRSDWVRALDAYRRAADAFKRVGDHVRLATVNNNIGEILSDRGEFDEAARRFDETERVWRAAGYPVGVGFIAMNQGRLRMRAGEHQSAGTALAESQAVFDELGALPLLAEARLRAAEAALVSGDAARATELLDAVDAIDDRDHAAMAPWMALVRAGVQMLRGDRDGAVASATAAVESSSGRYDRLHALETLAFVEPGHEEADPGSRADIAEELGIIGLPLLVRLISGSEPGPD